MWGRNWGLTSDAGEHELARAWCYAHARASFRHLPGTTKDAIHALEPVVNLARLHMREGRGDGAYTLLTGLYTAVTERRDTVLDNLHVPCSGLVRETTEHREVLQWVWTVLLAEGSRALTAAGRWQQAVNHLTQHRGIGARMLDGRQVAILAHLDAGQIDLAHTLVEETTPGRSWENAVTATLRAMCIADHETAELMVKFYSALEWTPGIEVFHTRLGLTVRDLLGEEDERAVQIRERLTDRVLAAGHGHCAREILQSGREVPRRAKLCALVRSCGVGTGTPDDLRQRTEVVVIRALDR